MYPAAQAPVGTPKPVLANRSCHAGAVAVRRWLGSTIEEASIGDEEVQLQ